jgi:hypothetical protein
MVAATALLVAITSRYDYHRDELYFRLLRPAWGYVDPPPLTPFLARTAISLFGDSVDAVRIPAALCLAVAVVLTALTTRELGGRTGAQALSAWGYAFAGIPMAFGHILLTSTVDLAIWAAVALFAIRALLREQPRWWLAAGAAAGLGLYNKYLIVLLVLSIGLSLLVVGPRRVLVSPWLGAGVLVALVVGAPNLVYQAMNDWSQLPMAAAIAENLGAEGRILLLPLQLILFGLPLVPIWVAGLVALLRRPQWRPIRAFAVAYPLILVIVLITSGRFYYPLGILSVAFAAGCIPAVEWAARGAVRRVLLGAAVTVNVALTLVVSLPLLPVDMIGDTPIPAINQGTRDQIGWPTYTRQVAGVYRDLPAEQAANAVIITSNYGEAGALDRYGEQYDLPEIYSGHNELHRYGPPPDEATTIIAVGLRLPEIRDRFERCDEAATLDNEVGIDNKEQDRIVAVCHNPRQPWSTLWPEFHHID